MGIKREVPLPQIPTFIVGDLPKSIGFVDYRVPTTADLPTVESVIVEVEAPDGPFGAKGVGEPPITPTLATMANAVADAVGIRITELPMKPEKVVDALHGNGK